MTCVGRNKSAQFRRLIVFVPELRGLVPAYESNTTRQEL
jgi:hypothetical protein